MSLENSKSNSINIIDDWFKSKCNGTWEHHLGVTIETTDNPGWLITVSEFPYDRLKMADIIGTLLRDYEAQVSTDGTMLRVFSPSLTGCLVASAVLIEQSQTSS